MRPILSWRNWIEEPGVGLSATSEATGLGLLNVATPQVGEVWRSVAGGTITIRLDFGAPRDIGMVALAAPRSGLLPLAHDTVRVTAGSAVDGADALDTGTVNFDAPNGVWCLPLAAGVAANRVQNPSGRDGAQGWAVGSQNGNAGLSAAAAPFALEGVGGLRLAQDTGAPGFMSAVAQLSAAASPGEEWQASVWVSAQRCSARMALRFRDAAFNATDFSSPAVPAPAWGPGLSARRGAWRRLTARGTAPAGRPIAELVVLGEAPTAGVPVVLLAEAAGSRAEGVAEPPPPFAGHLVPLALGRDGAAGVVARHVTVTVATARPYLQLGRLWVGPAWVPGSGVASAEAGVDSAGVSERAPVSGARFAADGAQLRRWSAQLPVLDRDDQERLAEIGMLAGTTRQIVAMQSVESWRATALFGRFSQAPAPQRQTFRTWPAAFAVEEDQ